MLNNLIFVNTARFILLVIIQVLLLNQINLFGYINPYLYILFIIIYPFSANKSLLIFLSFLLGLFVDFFSDSGGIHAAASVLLAETASGMVLGMNVPDDKLPLMKSLGAKFIKRSTGAQKAIATLTSEQINLIRETEKGDVNVAVKLIDSTGKEVVVTEMIWAWVPKKEK